MNARVSHTTSWALKYSRAHRSVPGSAMPGTSFRSCEERPCRNINNRSFCFCDGKIKKNTSPIYCSTTYHDLVPSKRGSRVTLNRRSSRLETPVLFSLTFRNQKLKTSTLATLFAIAPQLFTYDRRRLHAFDQRRPLPGRVHAQQQAFWAKERSVFPLLLSGRTHKATGERYVHQSSSSPVLPLFLF